MSSGILEAILKKTYAQRVVKRGNLVALFHDVIVQVQKYAYQMITKNDNFDAVLKQIIKT